MPATQVTARWLTRLLSSIALAGMLAGVPYGLVTQVGWPLPDTLPTTVADIERLLTTPVTDQVVINMLAVAMWLIWSSFAASFIGEVLARARGVAARRLPVIAPIQTISGWLLSGITAGVIAAATIAPIAPGRPADPPPIVHVVSRNPAPASTPPSVPAAPTTGAAIATRAQQDPPEQQPPVLCAGQHVLAIDGKRYAYVVQRGDSLWAIAEQCLGDGREWPRVWQLNQGRHFPAVGGTLHDPDLIYPGWDLHLPPDAVPPPDAEQLDPPDPGEAPVQPSPAELVDPEPTPTPAGLPPTPPEATTAPAPPSPTPAAASAPDSTATSAVPAEGGRGDTPPTGDDLDPDDRSSLEVTLPVGAALATAGLLTALLLTRLHQRRGRQQQHRRHGRRITQADPAVETTARIAAQPADVARLDHGLRTLAATLHGRDPDQLPDIVAVWLDTGTLHLLLARPCPDPPPPYQSATGGTIWTLPKNAALPDVDGQLSPLPALVTIASQPGGQHLLVDLERPGLLTITGDPGCTRDLLRYAAAELATAQWIDHAEVVLVGFEAEQTRQLIALGEDRLHSAASLSDALARAGRRVDANSAAIIDSGAGSSFAGRVNDIIADAWMPHLLLVADPDTELAPLESQLQDAGRCAVAVIAAATQPTAWSVHVDSSGRLSTTWLSIADAHAARLPADQLARLAAMLQAARTTLAGAPTRPEPDHGGIDEPVPVADGDQAWAQGTDLHGHLLDPHPPYAAADLPEPSALAGWEPDGEEQTLDLANVVDPLNTPQVEQPDEESAPERSPVVDPAHLKPADTAAATGLPDARPGEPDRLQPALALPEPPTSRPKTPISAAGGRRRRAPADPDLDTDLRDWHTPDSNRPRIAILGPVTINAPGQPPPDRPRFHAEIIVYLAARGTRGASADQLDDALWPERRISRSARRVNITKVRRWLGENADGEQWLPPNMGAERLYRLADGYQLDWHLFRRLRARGEARGAAGTADLHRALELICGAPLEGADRPYQAGGRNPYTWLPSSGIQPHHLASAIVDTAHQLVNLYLDAGDTAAARWAIERAWLADPDRLDDHPWLDLMRIAATDGHTSELRALVDQLVEAREAEVPEDLSPDTYREINQLAGDLLRVG